MSRRGATWSRTWPCSCVCNQMCIYFTLVSQARPHKSVNTQLVPHGGRSSVNPDLMENPCCSCKANTCSGCRRWPSSRPGTGSQRRRRRTRWHPRPPTTSDPRWRCAAADPPADRRVCVCVRKFHSCVKYVDCDQEIVSRRSLDDNQTCCRWNKRLGDWGKSRRRYI